MKLASKEILVFILMITFPLTLFCGGDKFEKKIGFELLGSFNNNSKSSSVVNVTGVKVDAGASGIGGKIIFNYHYSPNSTISISGGVISSEASTDITILGVTTDNYSVSYFTFGSKYYIIEFDTEEPLKPFLYGSAGMLFGSQVSTRLLETEVGVQTNYLINLGGGVDFKFTNLFKITLGLGYNITGDFDKPIGARKNYSGFEFDMGIGFTF